MEQCFWKIRQHAASVFLAWPLWMIVMFPSPISSMCCLNLLWCVSSSLTAPPPAGEDPPFATKTTFLPLNCVSAFRRGKSDRQKPCGEFGQRSILCMCKQRNIGYIRRCFWWFFFGTKTFVPDMIPNFLQGRLNFYDISLLEVKIKCQHEAHVKVSLAFAKWSARSFTVILLNSAKQNFLRMATSKTSCCILRGDFWYPTTRRNYGCSTFLVTCHESSDMYWSPSRSIRAQFQAERQTMHQYVDKYTSHPNRPGMLRPVMSRFYSQGERCHRRHSCHT